MCKKFLNKSSECFMLPNILMGLILQAEEILAGYIEHDQPLRMSKLAMNSVQNDLYSDVFIEHS